MYSQSSSARPLPNSKGCPFRPCPRGNDENKKRCRRNPCLRIPLPMEKPKRRKTHEGRNDPRNRHAQNTRIQGRRARPGKDQREETETSGGEKCSHRARFEILASGDSPASTVRYAAARAATRERQKNPPDTRKGSKQWRRERNIAWSKAAPIVPKETGGED